VDLSLDSPPSPWSARWLRLRAALYWRNLFRDHRRAQRAKRKQHFAKFQHLDRCVHDCRRLFAKLEVEPGDIVFVPTVTEFDLVWVTRFLQQHWHAPDIPWHLQFHFNFLEGRAGDYHRQVDRLAAMRLHFQRQLARVPRGQLRLYATTEVLAEQYNRLGVAAFTSLPYPVRPGLKAVPRPARRPLRVVSAGCVRREKGSHALEPLVRALWDRWLAPGALELVVQTDKTDFRIALPGGGLCPQSADLQEANRLAAPVVAVRAPLEAGEYARLVESADVGLFLYDSARYYTRASGVLVEMLACGVPVIVPAGCWLSQQIAEPIALHLERLFTRCATLATHRLRVAASVLEREESQTAEDDAVLCDAASGRLATELPVPADAQGLFVFLEDDATSEHTTHRRLRGEYWSADGAPLSAAETVAAPRPKAPRVPALLRVPAGAARVRLTLEDAFGAGRLHVRDLEVHFVRPTGGESLPAGAVGLISPGNEQLPALIDDLAENYAHYRHTAMEFARGWAAKHHPGQTVEMLMTGTPGSGAAPRARGLPGAGAVPRRGCNRDAA
jgi:hypothetical protein